jgi:succinate dehydrogenase/fumarate reductase flavoprotein subunit
MSISEGAAAAHDVLLVGGGAAGLRAAIAIAETNPSLSVAVISKVYPMRSHTVSAEGGAAGPSQKMTLWTSMPTTPSRAATGSATKTP